MSRHHADAMPHVNTDRLWQWHMRMARLGATGRGGVNRPALSTDDIELHKQIALWARERNFDVEIDDYGNQFMRRAGTDENCAPLVSGSHSDSQPTGGRFDGISGVLAALEAVEVMEEARIRTRHPLEIVIWNNEEGVRFRPTQMGSAVYAGHARLGPLQAAVDPQGVSLETEVDRLRQAVDFASERSLGKPFAGYLELHIEQGPILEEEQIDIGIVTSIQGTRKFEVQILGEAAHAGTTPSRNRRDALVDAVNVVKALQILFYDPLDLVRFTIGQFEVKPGALAVVPDNVFFTIDFRHHEDAVLKSLGDKVKAVCEDAAERCNVSVTETRNAHSENFPESVQKIVETACSARGYTYRYLPSGAGHDARYLNAFCPSGMVFIPCRNGISHNEAEYADPAALAKGAQIVADTLLMLDEQLTS